MALLVGAARFLVATRRSVRKPNHHRLDTGMGPCMESSWTAVPSSKAAVRGFHVSLPDGTQLQMKIEAWS